MLASCSDGIFIATTLFIAYRFLLLVGLSLSPPALTLNLIILQIDYNS